MEYQQAEYFGLGRYSISRRQSALDEPRDRSVYGRLTCRISRIRGLPLLFPVLDFEDRRNLTIDNLWDLRSEAINQASARYGADGILAGRIHFTPTGELVGLWQFQFQGEAQIFDGLDSDLKAYLEAPLRKVTDQLSDYFALPSVSSFERSITLRVDGIRTLADYAALLAYVSQLGIVPESSLASLDAGTSRAQPRRVRRRHSASRVDCTRQRSFANRFNPQRD